MSEYQELLKQRAELETRIKVARDAELKDAIAKARQLVADYNLVEADVFSHRARAPGGKVAPKYRDPATGDTWTGRGKAPRWIADKNRDDFLI